ncbi:MAG: hypothetical protein A2W26_02400 [Acidobacteria bacterium RBG_16_64_8]|nr:MAG: hypothetical protein A2W26_02400 [Acidobacteria bacterium RBG_16_64_8]
MALDMSRVGDHLYVGGMPDPVAHDYPSLGFSAIVLCASEFQPPADLFRGRVANADGTVTDVGMTVIRVPLNDVAAYTKAELEAEWRTAMEGSAIVARELRVGRRVLVTCMQGRNRSALVAALAMWRRGGFPGWYWCELVKARRRVADGSPVLSNAGYAGLLMMLPPPAEGERVE